MGDEPVHRPVTALAMRPELPGRLFTPALRRSIMDVASVDLDLVLTEFTSSAARKVLADVEVLFTGWGCPRIDAPVLEAAPRLAAIIHAAGTVKGHVAPECWQRGIVVSTAAAANALPVAEYTLAMILLSNKPARRAAQVYRERQSPIDREAEFPGSGNFDRTVGIIGASRIGRRVIELLQPFDLTVLVNDPFLAPDEASALGARWVKLDELVATSDVVSVHAPALPSTRHLLDRRRLSLLRDGATLINTARGWLIDHEALREEVTSGRINAILDVTEPDVPPADSPFYTLPNVVLTPHIAGAMGVELYRLAGYAIDELARYGRGEPLLHTVELAQLDTVA
jgi:phosphoglycerate dehydrogenase-like enzyme